MDAFYASVEQNDNPEYRGKPIVVGSPSERGVIAAASYEARKFGVKSAMPSSTAIRLCPSLVFVKHRMGRYKEVSHSIFDIFHSFTQKVEALSVDEAFIDISESCDSLQGAANIASEIKSKIKSITGLTASAGISYNKFLAKLASDFEKPNGLVLIDKIRSEEILMNLPIEKLYGIGKVTAEKLHLYGIHTCTQLREANMEFLVRNFGKAGVFYYNISRGIDKREVDSGRIRKSIGAELTFNKDLTTNFQIIAELYNIEKILWDRVITHGLSGRTITLKVKYDDFAQRSKSHTCEKVVKDFKDLHREVSSLRESVDFYRKKVRLMGVTISNLADGTAEVSQLDLWK
jgi:DNA polymerase-4